MGYPKGAAGVCAELVLREGARLIGLTIQQLVCLVEWIVGVKNSISQILVQLAVKVVGARLGAEGDHAAGELAPIRARVAGLHLELLDGILGWNDNGQVDIADVERLAIEVF